MTCASAKPLRAVDLPKLVLGRRTVLLASDIAPSYPEYHGRESRMVQGLSVVLFEFEVTK